MSVSYASFSWPSISPWKLTKNQKASLQTALGQMLLYTMHRDITSSNKGTYRAVLLQTAEPTAYMDLGVNVLTTIIKF